MRVACGKGAKERLVPLSSRLLTELRGYWQAYRPANWLFPSARHDQPLNSGTIQKACQRAAREAGLTKRVTPHTLRHSYATSLLSHAEGRVTFRAKNYRQGRKRQALSLGGVEFVRRFLWHVLPRGFVRIRYFGLLANTQRQRLLPQCRELIGAATEAGPLGAEASAQSPSGDSDSPRCPACRQGRLVLLQIVPRPKWRHLLAHMLWTFDAPPQSLHRQRTQRLDSS